jgi:hypothetical protein
MQAAISYLRAQFTAQEVKLVTAYAGEFSAAESMQLSYDCPAIFVTVLGWEPEIESRRLAGRNVRRVHMAAFVAFKHAKRDLRMAGAMTLADRAALLLMQWNPPNGDVPVQMAPLEEEPAAENLYGRAIDVKGQALWQLRWEQCVKPLVPLPQLYDLLSIEIIDNTLQGSAPAPSPAGGTVPTVTEEVNFEPLPFP